MGAQSLSIQEMGVTGVCAGAGGGGGAALGASPRVLAPCQRHLSFLTQLGEEQCVNLLTPTRCQALDQIYSFLHSSHFAEEKTEAQREKQGLK